MYVSIKNKKLFFIMLLLLIVAVLYYYNNNPAEVNYPICPFLYVTGYYCPGCGSSRALHYLLHFRFKEAFSYNPLMIISIPFVFYYCAAEIEIYINNKPVFKKIILSQKTYKIILFIIVLYWILRNIPYFPFTLLAP